MNREREKHHRLPHFLFIYIPNSGMYYILSSITIEEQQKAYGT